MPKFVLTVEFTFETDAPNTTEAKGRVIDINIKDLFKDRLLKNGLIYKRKSLIKCKRSE